MISLNTDTDPLCFIHVLNIRSSNRSTCNNSLREGRGEEMQRGEREGRGGEGKGKRGERERERKRKVHVHRAWQFKK